MRHRGGRGPAPSLDRERALVERLGIGVAPVHPWYSSQIVERRRQQSGRDRATSPQCQGCAYRAARHRRNGLGWYSSARWLSDCATSGWSGPSSFSRIATPRLTAARHRYSGLAWYSPARLLSDCRDIGMVGAQRLLADRQRALKERLSIGVATLVLVQEARLLSDAPTSGWSGPSTFSRIARARLKAARHRRSDPVPGTA